MKIKKMAVTFLLAGGLAAWGQVSAAAKPKPKPTPKAPEIDLSSFANASALASGILLMARVRKH
jgi:hypothetical protein